MIAILIVDDHSVVRQGLKSMIAAVHPEWEIFEAENGVQAILVASRVKPNLILMDHMMPKLDGIKSASLINRDFPGSKIIMVTMSNPEDLLPVATDAGVDLILSKDASNGEILETIAEFAKGIPKVGAKNQGKHSGRKDKKIKTGKRPERHTSSFLLTDRELEVVELMMKGYPINKISDHLGISKRTVEGHKFKIMKKCNLHSSSELIRLVVSNKILPVT
jgi:two-component system, NarL family, response regulator NreC